MGFYSLSLSLSRKLVIFIIAVLLIFGTFFSTLTFIPSPKKAHAVGNTYYVRADGTVLAANKANATSPNAAGTSLNMAQMKLATFAAGDQVLFSSQGGNYTEVLGPPSSGSGVGNEITYANVLNESPVITLGVGKMIQNYRTYIIIKGFTCIYTGTEVSTFGILLSDGAHVTLQNISVNMGGHSYGVYSSAILSDINFDNITVTNSGSGIPGFFLSGASNTNITVQNSAINGGTPSLQINNATSPTITDSSSTGTMVISTGSNATVSNISSTAGLTLSSMTTGTITNVNTGTVIGKIIVSTGSNITVSNIPATAGITFSGVTTGTISNVIASSTGGSPASLILSGSSGITVNDYSYSGPSYSFDIAGATTNVTVNRLTSTGGDNGALIEGTANNITINDSHVTNSWGYAAFIVGVTNNVSVIPHDITYNRVTVLNSHSGFAAKGNSYNITYNNCIADNNTNLGFLPVDNASNITYWRCEASYNGTVNAPYDGGGFLPHNTASNIKAYYCITHHNYNQGFGDVSTGAGNVIYNSISWSNGYVVGDTYKGVVVTADGRPTRGNNYWGKLSGNLIVNNGIFGGEGKPREIFNTGATQTTLDYNLYKPFDDNKFFNFVDNDNNTSWSVYHQTTEPHSNNSDPLFINATGNYTSPTDFLLSYLSPAIDTGTTIAGVTTDYAGNPIYGVFDKGAYEYQPPHSMGTNGVDVNAGARIYGDGKFRDLSVTSGSTASLSIAPTGGSFPAYGPSDIRPAWLDITAITWNNTGTRHKIWTESSAIGGLNNTVHNIGDLEPNKYYNVKIDNVLGANITGGNCTSGICLANGSGVITFTYSGGYSTHTFDVELNTTPPTASMTINPLSPDGTNSWYVTQPSIALLATDLISGINAILFHWDSDADSTYTFAFNANEGTHTLYYHSVNNNGISSTTGVNTIIVDWTAPLDFTPTASPSSWTSDSSIPITFVTTDGISGIDSYSVKLDGGAYINNVTSPYSLDVSSASDGLHTATVKAIDNAGNIREHSINIYLDKTAPVDFTPTANPASWTNANSISVTFATTDEISGVSSYSIKSDSGVYTNNVTSPYALNVSAVADGTHTVTVKAIDNAGNIREHIVDIFLDKTTTTASEDVNPSIPSTTINSPTSDTNLETPSANSVATEPSSTTPEIKVRSKNYSWWIVFGSILIILIAGFFLLRRKSRQNLL